jgi:hypothetical protein
MKFDLIQTRLNLMKNMSSNKGTSKANLKLRGEAPLTMNFGLVA